MATGETRELTFEDILVLKRIDSETFVERFGSKINSSFFEAANELGTLKLKGFVEIESAPGLSRVWLSESGKTVLAMADAKSGEDLLPLDITILRSISTGARDSKSVAASIGLRQSDVAFHLYKLLMQELIDYNMRTTKGDWRVDIMLTESGFNKLGSAVQPVVPQQAQPSAVAPQQAAAEPPRREKRFFGIFGGKGLSGPGPAPTDEKGQTIADELAPAEMPDAGQSKPLTQEELKRRMKQSKFSRQMQKWGSWIVLLVVLLIIAALAYVYITFRPWGG